ncbi:MAG TPA: hypothetical protein VMZ27_12530 [Candidatus Saccharimonadales bacterium]|nr:hypothetical protein [Candidatus Saccharimonadales bacterium]
MIKKTVWMLAIVASPFLTSHASPFADAVVAYDPGSGYSQGFTNVQAVVGEPSRVNPFGESTDPFDPPYGPGQILSIGTGGSLTVQFDTPILNHPHNLYGFDFTIFGNAGFIITNDFDLSTFNWIGIPATDGSLFAQNDGVTRVSVSMDGRFFYELRSPTAAKVDNFYPSDGSGDFGIPVPRQVGPSDFVGATLDQMRQLYHGSGGGASFDISWAVDARGRSVRLSEVRFVKVEVLSGKSEIDGFAKVLRAPHGSRDFAEDPDDADHQGDSRHDGHQ